MKAFKSNSKQENESLVEKFVKTASNYWILREKIVIPLQRDYADAKQAGLLKGRYSKLKVMIKDIIREYPQVRLKKETLPAVGGAESFADAAKMVNDQEKQKNVAHDLRKICAKLSSKDLAEVNEELRKREESLSKEESIATRFLDDLETRYIDSKSQFPNSRYSVNKIMLKEIKDSLTEETEPIESIREFIDSRSKK